MVGTSWPSTIMWTDKASLPFSGAVHVALYVKVAKPFKAVAVVGVNVNSRFWACAVQENSTCAEVSVSPTTLKVMPV